jgi:lipopolysaccharide transport system permease protein
MPFLNLGIFYFLFKIILDIQIRRFTSFAFVGIIAYNWFQSGLSGAALSTTGNRELVLRPRFPAFILPVVAVSSSMLHFIFTFPLILLIVFFEGHHLPAAIFLLPVVMGVQFILTIGLGYIATILNIIFRDTRPILDVLLRLFFFLSPVFYDPKMVPEPYQWLYNLNPLVVILQSYRDIILNGVMPPWFDLGMVAIFSLATAWIGFRIFQYQSYRFLEDL